MATTHLRGGLNLLGQGSVPLVSPTLPGHLEPQLDVPWGAFHQGVGSSVQALCTRASATAEGLSGSFFKDSWIERRIPRRALVAAALWHVVFVALPFPGLTVTRRHNPALDNFQLTWSGPVQDLPLLEIPRQKIKVAPRNEVDKPLPEPGADAFHARQRIFTDSVHPNHPRQTLINPAAPFEPPKAFTPLPNIVQLQQAPARPRLEISEETLKKLRPKELHIKTVTAAPPLDAPNLEQHVAADMSLAATQNGPARPKLEINAGAAPRVAQRAQNGDAGPAPEVGATQTDAGSSASTLIALSAAPAPPAAVQPPQGNLAARVSISPDAKQPGSNGEPAATGAGTSSVGVSISGGNPTAKSVVSGLGGVARIGAPSVRGLIARPDPNVDVADVPVRAGPPDFSKLSPGAKPEKIFLSKRVYTLNVNMPNLNSSTGSWILNFSELRSSPDAPRITSSDLTGPVPLTKVDPKYPPTLVSERVEGEVILYAVIRRDGSVNGIQLVRGIDEQLDNDAMDALKQWKFRPAAKQGTPVELEAIVHIPFRVPVPE